MTFIAISIVLESLPNCTMCKFVNKCDNEFFYYPFLYFFAFLGEMYFVLIYTQSKMCEV